MFSGQNRKRKLTDISKQSASKGLKLLRLPLKPLESCPTSGDDDDDGNTNDTTDFFTVVDGNIIIVIIFH